jgi:protein required for attachment to host cells
MFAAATAAMLNEQALANAFEHAVVIAPPKMLGELRKHFHKALEAKILKEIPKDLTGQSADQIAKTIEHA